MAEDTAEQQNLKAISISRLLLPLLIGATISVIIGFCCWIFVFTEPPAPPEDTHNLMDKKQQQAALMKQIATR